MRKERNTDTDYNHCNDCHIKNVNESSDIRDTSRDYISGNLKVLCKACGEVRDDVNENQLCCNCLSDNTITNNLGNNNNEGNVTVPCNTNGMNYDNNRDASQNRTAPPTVVDTDFWQHMDALLERKFTSFEGKLKQNVLEELHKITDPIQTELVNATKENKLLKAEVTACRAGLKVQEEKMLKLEKAVKEQQTFLARADKDSRLKRLLIAGVPENEDIKIKDYLAKTDREKATLIIQATGVNEIKFERARRIGPTDKGQDKRPRFILVEFNTW